MAEKKVENFAEITSILTALSGANCAYLFGKSPYTEAYFLQVGAESFEKVRGLFPELFTSPRGSKLGETAYLKLSAAPDKRHE